MALTLDFLGGGFLARQEEDVPFLLVHCLRHFKGRERQGCQLATLSYSSRRRGKRCDKQLNFILLHIKSIYLTLLDFRLLSSALQTCSSLIRDSSALLSAAVLVDGLLLFEASIRFLQKAERQIASTHRLLNRTGGSAPFWGFGKKGLDPAVQPKFYSHKKYIYIMSERVSPHPA